MTSRQQSTPKRTPKTRTLSPRRSQPTKRTEPVSVPKPSTPARVAACVLAHLRGVQHDESDHVEAIANAVAKALVTEQWAPGAPLAATEADPFPVHLGDVIQAGIAIDGARRVVCDMFLAGDLAVARQFGEALRRLKDAHTCIARLRRAIDPLDRARKSPDKAIAALDSIMAIVPAQTAAVIEPAAELIHEALRQAAVTP